LWGSISNQYSAQSLLYGWDLKESYPEEEIGGNKFVVLKKWRDLIPAIFDSKSKGAFGITIDIF
jgi:hypothetical protein